MTAPPALVGPDEEIVAGRRPVEEAFAARREARRLLVVPQRRDALEALVLHATRLRIPVVEVEGGTLTAVAGFDGHQGVALVVAPRRWASLDDVLARAAARSEPPFVLVLDSLEDPQNMGTLLRSADACGVHGVIFPTRNAAPLTPSAVKASAGAVEHLLLVPVDDLPGTLVDLRARGLHLVGTDAEAALSYRDADLRGPVALVIGSEGKGMTGPVRRRLELLVRIPMRGHVGSLNAAVAGSVLLFEAAAQRPAPPGPGPAGTEPGPGPQAGDGGAASEGASGQPRAAADAEPGDGEHAEGRATAPRARGATPGPRASRTRGRTKPAGTPAEAAAGTPAGSPPRQAESPAEAAAGTPEQAPVESATETAATRGAPTGEGGGPDGPGPEQAGGASRDAGDDGGTEWELLPDR